MKNRLVKKTLRDHRASPARILRAEAWYRRRHGAFAGVALSIIAFARVGDKVAATARRLGVVIRDMNRALGPIEERGSDG